MDAANAGGLAAIATLPAPPPLSKRAALFLDLDGSLLEIAQQPDAVTVPEHLVPLLDAVRSKLQGALAIVSGRELQFIDRLLTPLRVAGAGVHGAQLRLAPDEDIVSTVAAGLGSLVETLREYFADDPRVLIEDKRLAVALHFRAAPERAQECRKLLADLAEALALNLKPGNMVVEVLPPGPDKGRAVRALMDRPPFFGRLPLYLGDDATDEDGIRVVQEMGGHGVKIGPRPTAARFHLPDVAAVHRWLAAL